MAKIKFKNGSTIESKIPSNAKIGRGKMSEKYYVADIPIVLSVQEARAKLTDLLYDVKKLDITFIITKNGRPFAKLAPLNSKEKEVIDNN